MRRRPIRTWVPFAVLCGCLFEALREQSMPALALIVIAGVILSAIEGVS